MTTDTAPTLYPTTKTVPSATGSACAQSPAMHITEVCAYLGLARSTVYKLTVEDPTFPVQFSATGYNGGRCAKAMFVRAEIEAWLARKMAERSARQPA